MIVLFVCHANLNRSPRAAEVFRKIVEEKGLKIEVQSAGTHAWVEASRETLLKSYGVESVTQLTNELIKNADIVVALDPCVESEILNDYQVAPRRLIDLYIEDRFSLGNRNLEVLYEILEHRLEPLSNEIASSSRPPNKEIL